MHLLYLDDSGSVGDKKDAYVILAGLAVYERVPYWYERELDNIAASVWPDNPRSIEFRGGDIFSGRGHWRGVRKETRIQAYENALSHLGSSKRARLFGAAIHKETIAAQDPTQHTLNPMEYAFEQVCSRFDQYLGRLHRANNTQRGLIVLDKSADERTLQNMARDFRLDGHRWGRLRNLAEVPLFVDSKATRMIQFADMIAYALRRYYERGEQRYFDLIARGFDAEGGIVHGLIHYVPANHSCSCPSCVRRAS